MKVQFADNVGTKLIVALNPLLSNAREVRIAVAFVKYSGLRLIEPALDRCLQSGGQIEFIVGLDFRTTDAKSLRALRTRSIATPQCRLYCYSDPSDNENVYHPKLYLLSAEKSLSGIIGSSNLTQGGLKDNVEVNAILEYEEEEEGAQELLDIYARIKFQETRFVPDDEYLDAYEELTHQVTLSRNSAADRDLRKRLEFLRQKEQVLPKPFTDPESLRGWQKLVFDKLPAIEFGTSDLYRYAPEFQQEYPDNRNVEAKIRQVLQQLRDSGLINHLGQGRWVRYTRG
ncbi:MAG: hypothetical protein HY259_01230 [Chloroflexi bacterium]|nr:hypothetical protein [Chloroflexota bacterium]